MQPLRLGRAARSAAPTERGKKVAPCARFIRCMLTIAFDVSPRGMYLQAPLASVEIILEEASRFCVLPGVAFWVDSSDAAHKILRLLTSRAHLPGTAAVQTNNKPRKHRHTKKH